MTPVCVGGVACKYRLVAAGYYDGGHFIADTYDVVAKQWWRHDGMKHSGICQPVPPPTGSAFTLQSSVREYKCCTVIWARTIQ